MSFEQTRDISPEMLEIIRFAERTSVESKQASTRQDQLERDFRAIPVDIALLKRELQLVQQTLCSLKRLGWTLLIVFLSFVAKESYNTWLANKLKPPAIHYNQPGDPGR